MWRDCSHIGQGSFPEISNLNLPKEYSYTIIAICSPCLQACSSSQLQLARKFRSAGIAESGGDQKQFWQGNDWSKAWAQTGSSLWQNLQKQVARSAKAGGKICKSNLQMWSILGLIWADLTLLDRFCFVGTTQVLQK